ncbi:hypothetical protein CEXT_125941 [Caerostris extrusa]|uniref:Uncharacterized protein n=1 Tax=Caerostris extrusa TaxID=172846 RepID=A0AAV4X4Y7_CAEEX|nr:hypothetical protein CEXT_125941 [Caerostris extrusa]
MDPRSGGWRVTLGPGRDPLERRLSAPGLLERERDGAERLSAASFHPLILPHHFHPHPLILRITFTFYRFQPPFCLPPFDVAVLELGMQWNSGIVVASVLDRIVELLEHVLFAFHVLWYICGIRDAN